MRIFGFEEVYLLFEEVYLLLVYLGTKSYFIPKNTLRYPKMYPSTNHLIMLLYVECVIVVEVRNTTVRNLNIGG